MIITEILDYSLMSSFMFTLFHFAPKQLTSFYAVTAIMSLLILLIGRDHFYNVIFYEHIAKEKREYKTTRDNYLTMIKIMALFSFSAGFGAYNGLYVLEWKGFETALLISFEYWFITQVKDVLMMQYVHKWMHEFSSLYWLHKHHHTSCENLQVLTAFHFDILDVLIENLCGPIMLCLYYYYTSGVVYVNFASFLFVIWSDGLIHSLNPYSVILFNPLLDYLMKPNISHQLHHMLQKGDYMIHPWKHVLSPLTLKDDINQYNKICGTKVNYDLFIDTEETKAS